MYLRSHAICPGRQSATREEPVSSPDYQGDHWNHDPDHNEKSWEVVPEGAKPAGEPRNLPVKGDHLGHTDEGQYEGDYEAKQRYRLHTGKLDESYFNAKAAYSSPLTGAGLHMLI